ncbi:glycosyltransferase [Paenibacillus sp. GCM10012307]|uniref:Glycosyltransferase n=1 Tax=Paenibacillus roseus TaxID=2798579 RepID=A0A934MLY6_9BACL|nr:glycosyltransferase [Paenibacillus roseus]MBJ6362725.1 glycosyltransferase [Paenibacillus roseus]
MIAISLCMIVRNEENSLAKCLAGVAGIADEIIIVDTGSTDKTKEIAKSFGAKIYDFKWIDDFAAARNYSFSKATKEYILWLDADDTIEEKDQKLLRELKTTLAPEYNSVSMPYNLAFDGEGNVVSSLRRNRVVRRDRQFQWIGPVHEYLAVFGPIFPSDACITHKKDKEHTDRNLRIYRKRAEQGEEFSPRDLYYYANELRDHGLNEEAVDYYGRFLNTGQGWIEDNFQACLKGAECWAKQGNKEQEFQWLCKTLLYDKPRSEFSCRLGAYLFERGDYNQAVYWYDLALRLPENKDNMGMTNKAASTWLPHLQLCLCYDRLGQHKKASYHNELALTFYPSHPSMLYNRDYFKELLGNQYVEIKAVGKGKTEGKHESRR